MSSSPEAGHEKEPEATPEQAEPTQEVVHEKEAEATPPSGQEKEAAAVEEEVILKPVKPEAAAEEGSGVHITIKVTSQTAPDVLFRTKRDVMLRRIMDMYCGKHSLDPGAVVFLNEEGKHIRGVQTADQAGLDDGHSISVNIAQLGGSGPASST